MIGTIVFYHQSHDEFWFQQRTHPAVVTHYDPATKLADLTVFFRGWTPQSRSNIPLWSDNLNEEHAFFTSAPERSQEKEAKK